MNEQVKILSVLVLAVLLSACGQTGPLYMPGTATGVHKKDEFILSNSKDNKTPAKPADSKPTTNNTTASPTASTDPQANEQPSH